MATIKKQNAKGEGSFVFLKDKRMWRYSREINGTKIERVRRLRAEAKDAVEKLATGSLRGSFGELTTSSTISEVIQVYVASREKDGKRLSHEHRDWVLRRYVKPYLGTFSIGKLSTINVSAMMRDLNETGGEAKQGLSAQTCNHALKEIRALLNWSHRHDLVTKNVAAGFFIKSFKVEKNVRAMTVDEWQTLMKSMENEKLRAFVHLAVASGLRSAELCALTWDDFVIEGRTATVRVERTIQRKSGASLFIETPKTKTSRRTIYIAGDVVDELVAHRKRQDLIKSACIADGQRWGSLFPKMRWVFSNGVGNPYSSNHFLRGINRMCDEAGIDRYSIHELRHTCASFAIASGVGLKQLSEMLGHTNIATTSNVYIHLYPASLIETAVKISTLTDRKK